MSTGPYPYTTETNSTCSNENRQNTDSISNTDDESLAREAGLELLSEGFKPRDSKAVVNLAIPEGRTAVTKSTTAPYERLDRSEKRDNLSTPSTTTIPSDAHSIAAISTAPLTRAKSANILCSGCFTPDGHVSPSSLKKALSIEDVQNYQALSNSTIEDLEDCIGINRSGIGSTIYYDSVEDSTITFYDCEQGDCDQGNTISVPADEQSKDVQFDSTLIDIEALKQKSDDVSTTGVQTEVIKQSNPPRTEDTTVTTPDVIDCKEESEEEEARMSEVSNEENYHKRPSKTENTNVEKSDLTYDTEEQELEEKYVFDTENTPTATIRAIAGDDFTISKSEDNDVELSFWTSSEEEELEEDCDRMKDTFAPLTGATFRADDLRDTSSTTAVSVLPTDAQKITSISNFNNSQRNYHIERSKSAKMKAERIEAFFFNNGMTFSLGGLFLSMNAIVAARAAYQFTEIGGFTTDDDLLRITLPVARVGGRMVTFNCAWLLVTGCKYTWTLIRTHLVPVIPIGFPIDDIMPKYHRFVALWIIVSGCIVHALPQIVNYSTGAIKIDDGRRIWTLGNGFATRQLLITGSLLTFIFAMFYLTTLKAFRQTAAGFRWFWLFHMGGIALAYPLLIMHGTCKGNPVFLYSAAAPLVLYVFDVIMRRSKITNTKILEWKTHSDKSENITELIVECPPNFVHTAGQYAELKFLPISRNEWHPFTIASAPSNGVRVYDGKRVKVLIFFIKAAGRWTEALFNYASAFDLSRSTADMKVSIRGPHGAPAMNFFEYKHIIVIGSGVGVTPLLSVWQHMLDEGRSKLQGEDDSTPLSKVLSREKLSRAMTSPTAPSASLTYDSSTDLLNNDSSSVDSTQKFRLVCSQMESILESLTVSICLYAFFLAGETIIVLTQTFGCYTMVAIFEIFFASLSLVFHMGSMAVSAFANDEGFELVFKYWIEISIVLVDAMNLWLSISVAKVDSMNSWLSITAVVNDREEDLKAENLSRYIVALGGAGVFLHAIRIFHVFYTTLKPKTEKRRQQSKVCSIQGIFINRSYSGMRFCKEQLLQPLEEGLSNVFSLQFYGTREQPDHLLSTAFSLPDCVESFPASNHTFQNDYFSVQAGRPDFESIFRKAIRKAYLSDPDGESIGVFFCGSPAIAKCLRSIADKVNTEHQFVMKRTRRNSRTSKCKIVIHVEHFN